MKKSYKKMLLFQGLILLIFVLNSFVSNILKGYNFVLFLLISLILLKKFFGFERDRHRYTKDIIFEVVIFLLIFFVLFYLFGLVIGFARVSNYYNWYGFSTFIIPLVLTIILKEYFRYMMLKKCEGSKLLSVTTICLFIFLDITEAIYYGGFNSSYETFIFIALTLMPAISNNIVCTNITKLTGYKPVILYLLVIRLYVYLIPIIPNPNEYITAIINFMLPIVFGSRINTFFLKDKERDEELTRDYNKKRLGFIVLPLLLTMFIVYFTSGYFKYYAIAIASGSMSPKIEKGDVVVIEKIGDDYASLEVGQIVAYKYNNVTVVHRLIKIEEDDGVYYFYTKGDANNNEDNYAVKQDMLLGKVDLRIPYLGLPTVWLNEM